MIDNKLLRNDASTIAAKLLKKHYQFDAAGYIVLEEQRKELQIRVEQLQAQRNAGAKEIGLAKKQGKTADAVVAKMQQVNRSIEHTQQQLKGVREQLRNMEYDMPNIPDDCVPEGKDENDNRLVRDYGNIPDFTFTPLDHTDLSGKGADFSKAVKLSGSRFAVLYGSLAKLHRALAQFMIDTHTKEHSYLECYLPYLVHAHVLEGGGQLPKFAEDQFYIHDDKLYLIPTAEPALINLYRESQIAIDELPIRVMAHTPCFRREAGSYGKDTRGMFRQHQFDKVELVQITTPETSEQALEEITTHAETILQKLQLPYRIVELCGGDLGFSSARTYDIEVWLPSQNTYREISSCSNCRDFQARRMKTRLHDGKQSRFVHTLNGSGVAVGRALIAVMENYQQSDGTIAIPDVLKTYMPGVARINLQQER